MAKNKNGKELGKGISQRKDGRYSARFVTQGGKRVEKYFHTLHEARRKMLPWAQNYRFLPQQRLMIGSTFAKTHCGQILPRTQGEAGRSGMISTLSL